jgi:hypothetical protein
MGISAGSNLCDAMTGRAADGVGIEVDENALPD